MPSSNLESGRDPGLHRDHIVEPPKTADAYEPCEAPDLSFDLTGIYCERPAGHRGDHGANIWFSWSADA
ncbi:MAG TPA: hypothetical protein VKH61_06740 [Streptosporangiaceae bacterium]|nr:hypothetical protein [Streptosporangiaceae bacterium]